MIRPPDHLDWPTAATLNPAWLTMLAHVANTTAGLWLVSEPIISPPMHATPTPEPQLVGAGSPHFAGVT